MLDETIVGFIDILGYKNLVNEHCNNIDTICSLEDLLRKSSVGLVEKLKQFPSEEEQIVEEYYQNVLSMVTVRYISDSVLFTLPISKIGFSHPSFTKEDTIAHCAHLYFGLIANFCTLFISKTGLVFRGGISKGQHYESAFNSNGIHNLFIFSKAYIDAYELEKKAETPRIVIDDALWLYLNKLSNDSSKHFFNDGDGRKCFDIYCSLHHDKYSESRLTDIKKRVEANIRKNINKHNELCKLIYFARFHNMRVRKDKLNFEKLSIGVPQ